MRALSILLLSVAAASAFNLSALKPNVSSFSKYTILEDARDALQAKLPDAGGKLAAARDAVEAKFVTNKTVNLYTDAVTSGGVKKCVPTGVQKLITMGQVVNGEYFGVLRTIDGSGGGYVYAPVEPSNPYALPSNGATVNAAGAALGLRAAIQYSPNPDIPTVHLRDGKYYMVSHRETCPGGLDMVELAADKITGELVAVNTTNVDFSKDPWDGVWYPCSGK